MVPGSTGLLAASESALGTVDLSATAALSSESYSRVLLRVRVCTRQQDIAISTCTPIRVRENENEIEIVRRFILTIE